MCPPSAGNKWHRYRMDCSIDRIRPRRRPAASCRVLRLRAPAAAAGEPPERTEPPPPPRGSAHAPRYCRTDRPACPQAPPAGAGGSRILAREPAGGGGDRGGKRRAGRHTEARERRVHPPLGGQMGHDRSIRAGPDSDWGTEGWGCIPSLAGCARAAGRGRLHCRPRRNTRSVESVEANKLF